MSYGRALRSQGGGKGQWASEVCKGAGEGRRVPGRTMSDEVDHFRPAAL